MAPPSRVRWPLARPERGNTTKRANHGAKKTPNARFVNPPERPKTRNGAPKGPGFMKAPTFAGPRWLAVAAETAVALQ